MLPELTRKHVADMYYSGELEKEIRTSPYRLNNWSFRVSDDREEYIKIILNEIREKCYVHRPAENCPERGKSTLYTPQHYAAVIYS